MTGIVGRTYYEGDVPVKIVIQWGLKSKGESHGGPRSVMVEYEDGRRNLRPLRGLRNQPRSRRV